jgi:hypothetical protein
MAPAAGGADWGELPALFDLFPWQQPGCLASRTWPIAPSRAVLEERWAAFVAIADLDARADAFHTAKTGRNIFTRVPGMARLADLDGRAAHEPIVRYGFRSFDRQWIFEDPRLLKTEAPTLWAARSNQQIFMSTLSTAVLGSGPAASLSTAIPDYHNFRGSYGGKDVIPLYRDAAGTPNADPRLLATLGEILNLDSHLPIEDLFAYCYFVLSGTDYTARFAEELRTPGPRIPVTASRSLFEDAVEMGRLLIWIHSFGDRFNGGRGESCRVLPSVRAGSALTLPEQPNSVRFDGQAGALKIGDGTLHGVTGEVWNFEISGFQVVKKWLSYRTARGAGRAAGSSSPLDQIRPVEWDEEWTNELVELVSALQRTVDLRPDGIKLFDAICEGPLVKAEDLPQPPPRLQKPPSGASRSAQPSLEVW